MITITSKVPSIKRKHMMNCSLCICFTMNPFLSINFKTGKCNDSILTCKLSKNNIKMIFKIYKKIILRFVL